MSSQNKHGRNLNADKDESSTQARSQDVRISDAEWQVMDLLWRDAPQTSFRISERLSTTRDWSPKTVKTMLSRLVKKGFLGFQKEANRYLYFPTVSRSESIRREGRSFIDRLFGGDAGSMLLHFVESTELSAEQRDELRAKLDRMEQEPVEDDS
ncbi:MAG: BlaI/MecI/CopY family transcriptional regulator [Acidobacteriota bacterium]